MYKRGSYKKPSSLQALLHNIGVHITPVSFAIEQDFNHTRFKNFELAILILQGCLQNTDDFFPSSTLANRQGIIFQTLET